MTTPMQVFNERFPNIKLSYDKVNHKIVYGDLYMHIPFGTKVFAWFTYFNKNNICFIIEKNINKLKIYIKQASFSDELCIGKYGTILYGTLIKNDLTKIQYFYIEDIFYYKDSELLYKEKLKKITYIEDFFNHLNQNIYTTDQLGFCSPFVTTSKEYAINQYLKSHFSVYCIVSINLNSHNTKCCFSDLKNIATSKTKTKIFLVKPDTKNDIYKLYTIDKNNNYCFDSYALITSYQLSKTMNNIFRIIKENDNLDRLEESDDENEFENISDSKYIKHTDNETLMQCNYSNKFNKWIPNKIVKSF